MTKKQAEQKRKRLYELEEIAVNNCLEAGDFNPLVWLEDKNLHEYEKLQFELGDSDYNPDS